jgi:cysteine synthase B
LASAIVPGIYDASLADQNLEISTEDAHVMARRLAREQGLLLGVSAAAALVGSLQVIESLKINQRATIVAILCDSGEKYLSERFWQEE